MDVTIYHNPACGTSRNTLALIRNAGVEPTVIEYLKTPPGKEELADLDSWRRACSVRDAIRQKGTPYSELGLDVPQPDRRPDRSMQWYATRSSSTGPFCRNALGA